MTVGFLMDDGQRVITESLYTCCATCRKHQSSERRSAVEILSLPPPVPFILPSFCMLFA